METHQQRLAAYLERARGEYTDDQVRDLEMTAIQVDRRVAALSVEQRASYQDTFDLLSTAISEKYSPPADDDGYCCWGYLVDFDYDENWAVFSQKGVKYQVSYTLDGNTVTLGDRVPVVERTTYVPIETNSAAGTSATPVTPNYPSAKRAFLSLIEQPPAHAAEFQVRMADDGTGASFVGYPSTTGDSYNVRDWLGEYAETINAGAFAKTLREQGDVPLLFNHDGVPMASTGSGTSRLAEDGRGLRNEADLDRRDALTNSICVQLERGVLGKMSFAFRAIKEAWNDSYDERGVNELALYDTSIVTYPANPATSGELVEAMRSAMGREGRSLWLADHELSMRSALPALVERPELDGDTGDLLERAMRALAHADELVSRGRPQGRARTFQVAHAMYELRAGKTLSTANEKLLNDALTALGAADKAHAKTTKAHSQASDAVSAVLASAAPQSQEGLDGNQGAPTGGDPAAPQDGAGARAAALRMKREREAELRALRRH